MRQVAADNKTIMALFLEALNYLPRSWPECGQERGREYGENFSI